MQITRQTEYAIQTLVELVKTPSGTVLSARAISENQQIPEVFLRKTIQLLAKANLVTTQRGNQGGGTPDSTGGGDHHSPGYGSHRGQFGHKCLPVQ